MSFAYNFDTGYYNILFVVTLWAWTLSAAHFNMAITIGAFVMGTKLSLKSLKNNIVEFGLILLVQFLGSMFGILITFVSSHILYPTSG